MFDYLQIKVNNLMQNVMKGKLSRQNKITQECLATNERNVKKEMTWKVQEGKYLKEKN